MPIWSQWTIKTDCMTKSCTTCPNRDIGLLAGQTEKVAAAFSDRLQRYTVFSAGMTIFNQGQPITGIYFLCRGWAKLSRLLKQGDEVIIDVLAPCSLFGEFPKREKNVHSYSAIACEDSVEVAYLKAEDLFSLAKAELDFGAHVFQYLDRRLSRSYRSFTNMKLPLRERLISLLARFYRRFEGKKARAKWVMPLSQREIAQFLQVTPESVSRLISSLQEEGVLLYEKREIHVLKEEVLSKYLEESCNESGFNSDPPEEADGEY